ncbi:MAG: topoisomerase DNA-binding C4 zinc finger domain-containing protein [Pseudohongiella sp.]|uniref:topoisomerase DNA-binding C4 zinc finger domain-containing protein n=1 Tax=Pseudohongiella sp. TaxID=1979412 RepID=UPI00349FFFD1
MCADLFDGIEPDKPASTEDAGAAITQRVYYCPRCRNPMRRIIGKMGPFWGCTTYPACDKKLYDLNGHPSDTPDERYRCPVCTRPLVHAQTKAKPDATTDDVSARSARDDYWYCTGYNKGCKVTLPDANGKPAAAWRCPRCGHLLKQRRGKNGMFWGCSQYPLCTESFTDIGGKPKGPDFE